MRKAKMVAIIAPMIDYIIFVLQGLQYLPIYSR